MNKYTPEQSAAIFRDVWVVLSGFYLIAWLITWSTYLLVPNFYNHLPNSPFVGLFFAFCAIHMIVLHIKRRFFNG